MRVSDLSASGHVFAQPALKNLISVHTSSDKSILCTIHVFSIERKQNKRSCFHSLKKMRSFSI